MVQAQHLVDAQRDAVGDPDQALAPGEMAQMIGDRFQGHHGELSGAQGGEIL